MQKNTTERHGGKLRAIVYVAVAGILGIVAVNVRAGIVSPSPTESAALQGGQGTGGGIEDTYNPTPSTEHQTSGTASFTGSSTMGIVDTPGTSYTTSGSSSSTGNVTSAAMSAELSVSGTVTNNEIGPPPYSGYTLNQASYDDTFQVSTTGIYNLSVEATFGPQLASGGQFFQFILQDNTANGRPFLALENVSSGPAAGGVVGVINQQVTLTAGDSYDFFAVEADNVGVGINTVPGTTATTTNSAQVSLTIPEPGTFIIFVLGAVFLARRPKIRISVPPL